MPKPEPAPAQHHLDLFLTVGGDEFQLSGVFRLEDGLRAFDHWLSKLNGPSLTPAQVTALITRAKRTADRAEAVATALESLDAETP